MNEVVRRARPFRLASVWCAVAVLASGAVIASAQQTADFVSATPAAEMAPRTVGDWVVWSGDAQKVGSLGTVVAKRLSTGSTSVLGAGFLPDVDNYAASKGGGAAVPPPGTCGPAVTRVAYLRYEPDETFSVVNACFDGDAWSTATLATELVLADHVRVSGNYTTWNAPAADGRLHVFLHDGVTTSEIPSVGDAYRPELARGAAGRFALVWDEYVGGPGDYDYEVFGMFKTAGTPWSAIENLSAAPAGIDIIPSVAFAPDGGAWVAWASDRGASATRTFVARRQPDGQLLLPEPYPASADPAQAGLVLLSGPTPGLRPQLHVGSDGRVWLFVETKLLGPTVYSFDKFIVYSTYDGDRWAEPGVLPGEARSEQSLDTATDGDGVRVVYQFNTQAMRSTDIATVHLTSPGVPAADLLVPVAGPAAPPEPLPKLTLPSDRSVIVDGQERRLVFADLHSHSGVSPDAMGERDQCLYYARDVARLDVWALTDHDEALYDPLLDWEYAQGLRLMEHFDAPGFTTFMGFEWTNGKDLYMGEVIGHRATFSSSKCYRFTDAISDELPEYYALMLAEDAIGVPHHLDSFGGTTFLLFDATVQPVTQVSSVHGVFENTLVKKLLDHPVRFGVTSAGDHHIASPGFFGLAGVLVDPALERHAGIKAALRERLTFGARRNGMFLDLRINDRPLGAELLHAGPALLHYRIAELPGHVALNVNVSRNGAWGAPVHQAELSLDGAREAVVLLPASEEPVFYMLRVTETAAGLDPVDTILWSSPIWIDPEPADDYPAVTLDVSASTAAAGTPLAFRLTVVDPQGAGDLGVVRLHASLDGQLVSTLESPLLEQFALVTPVPGGLQYRIADLQLHTGAWQFVLDARDAEGHFAVAAADIQITP